jgi:tetratricopeptide (TPR) repeat protein
MKNFVFALLLFAACSAATNTAVPVNVDEINREYAGDSLLTNIEAKIMDAFIQGFMAKNTQALETLDDRLAAAGKEKPSGLIQYWRAYNHYYQSIAHIKGGDKVRSEQCIEKAIVLLDELRTKNTEDYALLAHVQGFAIQFKSGMGAGMASARAKRNGEAALKADPNNLRAHFVLGSLDYYTPKQFGGGKKTEGYLLKAISLPAQSVPNPYLPGWGKNEAYAMLVEHYIDKGDKEQAKKHYQDAVKLYPDDYQLAQLAKKLI